MTDVSFEDARRLARDAAAKDLLGVVQQDRDAVLSDRWLIGEHCWFFFRNADIELPELADLKRVYSAYAVSHRGAVRNIADFSTDPVRLSDYLSLMSAFFAHIELGGPKPVLPDWMSSVT